MARHATRPGWSGEGDVVVRVDFDRPSGWLIIPIVGLETRILVPIYAGIGAASRWAMRWIPPLLVALAAVTLLGSVLANRIVKESWLPNVEVIALELLLTLVGGSLLVWVARSRRRVTISSFERYARQSPEGDDKAETKAKTESTKDAGVANLVALELMRLND